MSNERLWLKTTGEMVNKIVLMLRNNYMKGGYGDDLDLVGIERAIKNLYQKLTEYTTEIEKLRESDKANSDLVKELKTKLEMYDKVFQEFSPSNQKIISKIKERVEKECKSPQ